MSDIEEVDAESFADQLRQAIALSLQDDNVSQPTANLESADPLVNAGDVASSVSASVVFGSVTLDRKRMEEERLERLRGKKRAANVDLQEQPAKRKAKSSHENTVDPRTQAFQSPLEVSNAALPFLNGAVRRTWARGFERSSDDIKIEEVFQRDQLELAILSSFQWDDEWLLSKLNLSRTKLVCVAYAEDDAHVSVLNANFLVGIAQQLHRKSRCAPMFLLVGSGFAFRRWMGVVPCMPRFSY